MCLECEPENYHECCKLQLTLAREYARGAVPKIYARRVGLRRFDTLYAVWMERNGSRVADCIEACCSVCAKADFIGKHFIVDQGEAELNKMFALEDLRPEADVTVPSRRRSRMPGRDRASHHSARP